MSTAADEAREKATQALNRAGGGGYSSAERESWASIAGVWAEIYKTDVLRENAGLNEWGV